MNSSISTILLFLRRILAVVEWAVCLQPSLLTCRHGLRLRPGVSVPYVLSLSSAVGSVIFSAATGPRCSDLSFQSKRTQEGLLIRRVVFLFAHLPLIYLLCLLTTWPLFIFSSTIWLPCLRLGFLVPVWTLTFHRLNF